MIHTGKRREFSQWWKPREQVQNHRKLARCGGTITVCLMTCSLGLLLPATALAKSASVSADFFSLLSTRFGVCELSFEIAMVRDDAHQEGAEHCIDDAMARAAALYPGAVIAFDGQRPATTLLEDFYTLWQTDMEGLAPQPTETLGMYTDRQAVAQDEMEYLGKQLTQEEQTLRALKERPTPSN